MASNWGSSTPNPRFTSQRKTAEDQLATQTVGLVELSDFRKRRAEVNEQKERAAHDASLGIVPVTGTSTPGDTTPDGTLTPNDTSQPPLKKKKIKKNSKATKLSFQDDEDASEYFPSFAPTPLSNTPSTSRDATPLDSDTQPPAKKAKLTANANLSFVPKALTKSALLREAQTRESLRKDFIVLQDRVKACEIAIPFVFYDGTNIPGGTVRVKKGDFIWVFLDRSRKVGAELAVGEKGGTELVVGEKGGSRREWVRVGVDDLMFVRGNIIIPHHYDFYYFIINHTLGPNARILFDYSSEPPTSTPDPTPEPINLDTYNPLSIPSKDKAAKPTPAPKTLVHVEGMNDDPIFTKVVDRRWYERNKHIFPASIWQVFDPEKDYQKEVKRDAGGNAFFFS